MGDDGRIVTSDAVSLSRRASLRQRLQEGRASFAGAAQSTPRPDERSLAGNQSPFHDAAPVQDKRLGLRVQLRSRDSFTDITANCFEEVHSPSVGSTAAGEGFGSITPRSDLSGDDYCGTTLNCRPLSPAPVEKEKEVKKAPLPALDIARLRWRRRSSDRRHSVVSTTSAVSASSAATEYWVDDTVSAEQKDLAQQFNDERVRQNGRSGLIDGLFPIMEWYSFGTGCCAQRAGHGGFEEISQADRGALTGLRAHCTQAFELDSSTTEAALLEIWNAALPSSISLPNLKKDVRWQENLGFSSAVPNTGVCGQFALLQLQYLAQAQPLHFKKMAKQAKELRYPFARTCFNLSHLILVFFRLGDGDGPLGPWVDQATSWQQHNFLSMCRRSEAAGGGLKVLHELFCVLVDRMHCACVDAWVGSAAALCEQMPRLLKSAYDAHSKYWERSRIDIDDVHLLPEFRLP
eukprot:TRINITY_DN20275_c0_g1_i1.p1 TRINITY_DN20275_c0_g1~~TRINITY_DN20275_c0_g1_i1.p1  ORF type:complete len:462 (-),score=72.23 TRINITY_DN20275_c0_g1_i1:168-1553(-)